MTWETFPPKGRSVLLFLVPPPLSSFCAAPLPWRTFQLVFPLNPRSVRGTLRCFTTTGGWGMPQMSKKKPIANCSGWILFSCFQRRVGDLPWSAGPAHQPAKRRGERNWEREEGREHVCSSGQLVSSLFSWCFQGGKIGWIWLCLVALPATSSISSV